MQGKNSRRAAWLAALVVLLLAVGGGVAFLALGGEDEAKAKTIHFEAPTDVGPDPFTEPADHRGTKKVRVLGEGPFGGTGSDLVDRAAGQVARVGARPRRDADLARGGQLYPQAAPGHAHA